MKITDLSAQRRQADRVNVYVDGKYELSLTLKQVVDHGVAIGKELSEQQLAVLRDASVYGKVYQRALEYVLMRPRSVKELQQYLERRRRTMALKDQVVSVETMASISAALQEKGYVDDTSFARYWVENRNVRKGASLLRLRTELRQKGVEDEVIQAVLQESPRDDEIEIKKIIEKKHRYSDERLMSHLARQGFSYDVIKRALLDR